MNWTRRRLLKVGSGVAASQALWLPGITGCSSAKPLPKLLRSKALLPEKFCNDLPRLPVLKASSTEGSEDRYSLKAVAAGAKIIPGLNTTIWGFNGTFPARPSKRDGADASS